MTWTKLSDDFSDDCWQLSDAAFRLHVEGLVWSNRKLLDLVLPKDEVQRWAKNPGAATELVDCGWWTDNGDTYRVVHHGLYQRSRDAVLKQQDANRKNGRRGGRPSGPAREQAEDIRPDGPPPETDSLTDSLTETDGTGQDGPGQEGVTKSAAQLPLAAVAEETEETEEIGTAPISSGRRQRTRGAHRCPCGGLAPARSDTGLCDFCTARQQRETTPA